MKWTAFAFVLLLFDPLIFPKQAKLSSRAYSRSLLRAAINRLFSKYFQILHTFVQIFKYFAHLCPFLTCLCHCCPFFWKIACMPLLSKIGPDHHGINLFYLSLIFLPRLEEYTDLLTRKSLPHRNFPCLNQNRGRCLFLFKYYYY